jgi:hypothetical protein
VAIFGEGQLPPILTNTWWTFIWNIIIPVVVMLVVSKLLDARRGPAPSSEYIGLVYAHSGHIEEGMQSVINRRLSAIGGTWLEKTLDEFKARPRYPFAVPPAGLPLYKRPAVLAIAYLVVFGFLTLVLLW